MQLRPTLTGKEVGEGYGLVKDADYWKRIALVNLRLIIVVLVLLFSIADRAAKGQELTVGLFAGEGALIAFLIVIVYVRLTSKNAREAKVNNATAGTLSVEQNGIHLSSSSGATAFEPWGLFNRWAEGKHVFRLKGKVATRTLPKEGLSTMDLENLRNLISVNVRTQ